MRLDVDAAVSAEAADRDVFAVRLHRFVDLHSKFARRCQHQHAHRVAGWRRARAGKGKNALQERQGKSSCFTGSGLGATHQILAGKNNGNRLRLNRRWDGVALLGDGLQQFRRKAELVKTHRRRL